ncbi:hypothetical protein ACLB2K_077406 [Fragaria x ananassa]
MVESAACEIVFHKDFDTPWDKDSFRVLLDSPPITLIPFGCFAHDIPLVSRILDPFRSSLTPKMVEALVCTSDWLRTTSKPLFKEPVGFELQQYAELETMEAEFEVTNIGDLPEEAAMTT